MRSSKVIISAALAYLGSVSLASACVVAARMNYDFFTRAYVVMRAEIVDYQAAPDTSSAWVTFRPTEVLTRLGRSAPMWHAHWYYSTYNVPKTWTRSKDVIVGLRAVLTTEGGAEVQVVQQPCGPASVPEYTPATFDKVKAILASSKTNMYD